MPNVTDLFLLLLIGCAFTLYFVPSIVAVNRNHRNTAPICVVNMFLGWTLFGWVIALAWSLTDQRAT